MLVEFEEMRESTSILGWYVILRGSQLLMAPQLLRDRDYVNGGFVSSFSLQSLSPIVHWQVITDPYASQVLLTLQHTSIFGYMYSSVNLKLS